VAVVCDFLDEGWYSMDLVGNMLCQHLRTHAGLSVTQVRPEMTRFFRHLPFLGKDAAFSADRLLGRFVQYPLHLRALRHRFDLFHIVDHSYGHLVHSLPPGRALITCHDLGTFRCLLEPEKEPRPLWFRGMVRRVFEGFRKASFITCVSGTVRAQLLAEGVFSEKRITVIPNGVHPAFSPLADEEADREAAQLLGSSAGEQIELLNVGTTAPRKRIDVLLRAVARIRKAQDVRLVRVGGPLNESQQRLATELGLADSICQLPYLSHEVLAAVYRRATIVLQTSEMEGFGLPPVEAMACGCVVLVSDLPVLREVCGDCAEFCAVGDVEELSSRVCGLLRERSTDSDRWERRRQKGIARSGLFNWSEVARETLGLYGRLRAADGKGAE
jgi:glycosyltransferase involved in cell wall biosynthesis